jgi:hypothetical protein
MTSQLPAGAQTVTEPSSADLAALDRQRAVITSFLAPTELPKFATPAGKLGTLRALLQSHTFKASQTYELQSMGIVLGDVFVQDMGFHWVMVKDEHGRDPAVKYKQTSVILYPMTMISKRVERGEPVDVFDLYNGVAASAKEIIAKEQRE